MRLVWSTKLVDDVRSFVDYLQQYNPNLMGIRRENSALVRPRAAPAAERGTQSLSSMSKKYVLYGL